MSESEILDNIEAELMRYNEHLLHVESAECEVYQRIVGYYRSLKNWNRGKRDEYKKRKAYKPHL